MCQKLCKNVSKNGVEEGLQKCFKMYVKMFQNIFEIVLKLIIKMLRLIKFVSKYIQKCAGKINPKLGTWRDLCLYTEKTIFPFPFILEKKNLTQMEFHLVQNRKENCHHDHIPFNVKGNGNIAFSVYCAHISRYRGCC